ncbi:N-acetyltransferase, partial [Listeria monocytogenes]|nr:N-acetyltransferase [Listeria monocytogenes]
MNIKIRNEQPNDYRKVEEITREAFWNLYCPGCNEHFIVHNLRKHEDFIEELAFVI